MRVRVHARNSGPNLIHRSAFAGSAIAVVNSKLPANGTAGGDAPAASIVLD